MTMHTPDVSFGHEVDSESRGFERPASASMLASSAGPISHSPISLGPLSVTTRSKYEEAHRLACVIEELLTPVDAKSIETEGYGPRLARALVRNLIDHLADLNRSRVA
jgi:hypothetical protein